MQIYSKNNDSIIFSQPKQKVYYQPNFILISNLTEKTSLFGDIIPFYRSNQALTEILDTVSDSLMKSWQNYTTIFACALNLCLGIINSTIYQTYLGFTLAYQQVLALPNRYHNVKKRFAKFMEMFLDEQTRDLWWISSKLSLRFLLNKVTRFISITINICKKFYLLSLVTLILGIVNLVSLNNSQSNSFLNRFFNNHTYTPSSQIAGVFVDSSKSFSLQTNFSEVETDSQKVFTHTLSEGENLDVIASTYGVSIDTIKFNNQISDENKLPAQLKIPWQDGVLYQLKADSTPEELQKKFLIEQNIIKTENEQFFDSQSGKFTKDSTLFLPTTEFAKLQAVVQEDNKDLNKLFKNDEQKSSDDKTKSTKEEAKTQTKPVKEVVKPVKKAEPIQKNTSQPPSKEKKNNGFIWPAKGVISRCVQPGHIACDIANNSLPAIYSVTEAKVSAVYRYSVTGYGLAVLLDHGNGTSTLYAHMSEIYVQAGQQVSQGHAIGRMGCTGSCTGPHVHFEVRKNGVKQNPLNYLP